MVSDSIENEELIFVLASTKIAIASVKIFQSTQQYLLYLASAMIAITSVKISQSIQQYLLYLASAMIHSLMVFSFLNDSILLSHSLMVNHKMFSFWNYLIKPSPPPFSTSSVVQRTDLIISNICLDLIRRRIGG